MSKAFWEGFWVGWFKTLKYSLVFLLGVGFGYYLHYPYESCKHMHETVEDISECVWSKDG